jgi:excisionase family DNA binding protein
MSSNQGGKDETAPIAERFLTLSEAAEILRLRTRTVREYVQRGEIKGRIIGNRWRFRRADLDAFFENAPSRWDFAGKDRRGLDGARAKKAKTRMARPLHRLLGKAQLREHARHPGLVSAELSQ